VNEHVPDVETPLGNFLRRLRILGASQDEVLAISENWFTDTDDWGEDDRARLLRSSDGALVKMIRQVRQEYAMHTEPDPAVVELDLEPLAPLELEEVD
jgi:hypothetical protein